MGVQGHAEHLPAAWGMPVPRGPALSVRPGTQWIAPYRRCTSRARETGAPPCQARLVTV